MSIEAGFRAILGGCIAQIQDNAIGVVQGADSESIHQMRMGLRRLRLALGLFARWIPCPPTLQQELGWLASELGIARDADVLAKSTLPKVLDICPHDAELLLLGEAVSMMACAKKQQAALAVASERYSRLMRHLADWLHTKDWRESLAESARKRLAQPLAGRATRILACRHEKLIAPGKRLSESSPEDAFAPPPRAIFPSWAACGGSSLR